MAKQLLDAVNEILKRVRVIDTSNTGLLTSLTNSNLQHAIDVAVQVVNEGIDELYSATGLSMPKQGAESTFTLATGVREYPTAANLIRMHWPPIDKVNTQYIFQWDGTYDDFLLIDPQQVYTGLPTWGMISPITGLIRVDRAPDTLSNGRVYTYEYDRNMVLVLAADAIPFNDQAFRAMVPAWVQYYKREERNEFDNDLWSQAMGRASRALPEDLPQTSYSPRR